MSRREEQGLNPTAMEALTARNASAVVVRSCVLSGGGRQEPELLLEVNELLSVLLEEEQMDASG